MGLLLPLRSYRCIGAKRDRLVSFQFNPFTLRISIVKTVRSAVVAISPAPYREHIFSRLARDKRFRLEVFYAREPVLWNNGRFPYPVTWLPEARRAWLRRKERVRYMHGTVFRELSRFGPDAMVSYGYERWPMMGALLWAFCGQIPVLLRNDANAFQPFRGFQKWRRRFLAHCLDSQRIGALVIGRSNARYWTEQMSLPADRRFWTPYSVDNAYFERESARLKPERETVKARWRVGGKRVVLFVGRLEKVKGLSCLLRAYRRLREHRPDVALVLAGEGSLRAWVERVVSEEGIPDVVLTGFMQQEEIPQAYAAADVFVLPSEEEPWGLVVNEAMASGLPVVVCDSVGAWVDLVRDGEYGYVIPAGDAAALAEAMERVLSGDAHAMGERSRQMVKSHSVEHEAQGFLEAFQAVEEGRL